MTDEKKPVKLTFAPGCFDNVDFESQEEIDELIAKIQEMADSGELEKQAVLIDPTELLTEEEIDELLNEIQDEIGVQELGSEYQKNTRH